MIDRRPGTGRREAARCETERLRHALAGECGLCRLPQRAGRIGSGVLVAVVLLSAGALRLPAQGVCGPPVTAEARAPAAWAKPFDRLVTIRLENAPFRDALDRVAVEAGLRLSYSRELLPAGRRVCLDHVSAPVGSVLQGLLAGTMLEALSLGGDQVAVRRRAVDWSPVVSAPVDSPIRVEMLAPVIVTDANRAPSSPRDDVTTLTRIEGDDLRRAELRTLDQVVGTYLPGSWTGGPGHAGLRGASSFGASAPKIYLDGIELANPSLTTVLDPDVIDRIEIIRGPQGTALYGADALDGVVNITTRHDGAGDAGVSLTLRSAAGVVDAYEASSLVTQSHSMVLRAGSVPRSLSIALTDDESTPLLPGGPSRQLSALATGRIVGGAVVLGITGRIAALDATSPALVLSPAAAPADYPSIGIGSSPIRESIRQYTLGVSAEILPAGRWRHSLTAGIDGYRSDKTLLDPLPTLYPLALTTDGLPASAARTSIRAASVRRIADTTDFSATLTVGVEHTALAEAGPSLVAASRTSTGALSQLDLSLHEIVHISAGLRLERSGIDGAMVPLSLLPMVGASLVADRGATTIKLRGAYGVGIRAPRVPAVGPAAYGAARAMRSTIVMPEQQAGYEIGFDLLAADRLSLQVTWFDQLASGLRQPVMPQRWSGRGLHQEIGAGQIENRGWEIRPAIAVGPLWLDGTLSLIDSRVRGAASHGERFRAGTRVPGVPAFSGALALGYEGSRTAASVGISHLRGWSDEDRGGGTETSSAVAFDEGAWSFGNVTGLRASFSRELGRGLSLILTGDNLLAERWGAIANGTLVAGRTITGGLRFDF
jgi:iron complex outermembrane receptor protein